MRRLYTTDTKAINHILMNSYTYQKPGAARYQLSQILGSGVLVVEEDKHKQQRRIMVQHTSLNRQLISRSLIAILESCVWCCSNTRDD